jgi:hypothetical protein
MKICNKCGLEKSFMEFSKNRALPDGYQRTCKECLKESSKAWRAANKERAKEYQRLYTLKNQEKLYEATRRWQDSHRARVNEVRKKHNAKLAAHNSKRRALKLQATPWWADLENIAVFYELSREFTYFFKLQFHVDHIVPLRSEIVCGLHCESNLRIIEGTKNISKGNRIWPFMP